MRSLRWLLHCLLLVGSVTAAEEANPGYQRMILMKGAWLYQRNCAFCHDRDGRGAVGPNLTDWYFLHGPTKENLRTVIDEGVPEKGMPVWKTILKPADRRLIEHYVWSLRGTERKGKAPEGQLFKSGETGTGRLSGPPSQASSDQPSR